jgi:hypothetical protein
MQIMEHLLENLAGGQAAYKKSGAFVVEKSRPGGIIE